MRTDTRVSARDIRYQAAVIDAGRLLLYCVPHTETGFWVLPGGGEGWAELTAVRWLPLEAPAEWEPELCADPFLYAQLLRIRAALRDPHAPADA